MLRAADEIRGVERPGRLLLPHRTLRVLRSFLQQRARRQASLRHRPPTARCSPAPSAPGLWSGAPLSGFVAGAELRDGRKLAPDELHASVLQAITLQ